jgi:hypothetical protein
MAKRPIDALADGDPIPGATDEILLEFADWCADRGCIDVENNGYPAANVALTTARRAATAVAERAAYGISCWDQVFLEVRRAVGDEMNAELERLIQESKNVK